MLGAPRAARLAAVAVVALAPLQFHMEVNPGLVKLYVESQGQWPSGKYVQESAQILSAAEKYCEANRVLLHGMLDRFFALPAHDA